MPSGIRIDIRLAPRINMSVTFAAVAAGIKSEVGL